ncbi:MAG: hypothetical protein DYG85_16180 [Chloroflexi bacterium CFX1]|nr:hypothetical protein [Chloroflexi bacterium CFX1]MCQ3954467.1 hypothetical protein [Chloroflexota bacterium]MDL1920474.1 hypothetical protein [Chloroflexi bacterium CFX5]NUQ60694.1 hypothetical protein [Anaerolineales bacterium]
MTVHVSTHTKQVSKLAKLYEDGQVSDATARTLNKVVDFEVHQLQTDLAATEKDMGEFERQYGMSTEDFFRQWQAGVTDDRMDYVEWASLAQMAENLRKRLEFLTDETR